MVVPGTISFVSCILEITLFHCMMCCVLRIIVSRMLSFFLFGFIRWQGTSSVCKFTLGIHFPWNLLASTKMIGIGKERNIDHLSEFLLALQNVFLELEKSAE